MSVPIPVLDGLMKRRRVKRPTPLTSVSSPASACFARASRATSAQPKALSANRGGAQTPIMVRSGPSWVDTKPKWPWSWDRNSLYGLGAGVHCLHRAFLDYPCSPSGAPMPCAAGSTVRSRTNGIPFSFLLQAFWVKSPFVREQFVTKYRKTVSFGKKSLKFPFVRE